MTGSDGHRVVGLSHDALRRVLDKHNRLEESSGWDSIIMPADLSGRWSGTADLRTEDGKTNTQAIRANFVQTKNALSGSIGPSEDVQFMIEHGLRDGASASWSATRSFPFRIEAWSI